MSGVQAADRIQAFVEEAGEPRVLLAKLAAPGYPLAADTEAAAALAEMGTLFDLLASMGSALDHIRCPTGTTFSFNLLQRVRET